MLGIPRGPQVWVQAVSHAIYVGVTIINQGHFILLIYLILLSDNKYETIKTIILIYLDM